MDFAKARKLVESAKRKGLIIDALVEKKKEPRAKVPVIRSRDSLFVKCRYCGRMNRGYGKCAHCNEPTLEQVMERYKKRQNTKL